MRIASAAPAIRSLPSAAMTSLLWAQPRTSVLEIFSPDWLHEAYEQITLHFNLNYRLHMIGEANSIAHLNN
jgi:hypothetical protein